MKYVAAGANPAIAPTRRIRVLIALDDPGYRARLTTILYAAHYAVEVADSCQTLRDSVQSGAFELIILGIQKRGSE
ncbi:MAG: response regulator [Bdellovibrionota bacterium]